MNLEKKDSDGTTDNNLSEHSPTLKKNVSFRQTYSNPLSPELSITDIGPHLPLQTNNQNTNKSTATASKLVFFMRPNSSPTQSRQKVGTSTQTAAKSSSVSFRDQISWQQSVDKLTAASKISISPAVSSNLYVHPDPEKPQKPSRQEKLFGCVKLPSKKKSEAVVPELKPVPLPDPQSPPSPERPPPPPPPAWPPSAPPEERPKSPPSPELPRSPPSSPPLASPYISSESFASSVRTEVSYDEDEEIEESTSPVRSTQEDETPRKTPVRKRIKRRKPKVMPAKRPVMITQPKDYHHLTHLKLDNPELFAEFCKFVTIPLTSCRELRHGQSAAQSHDIRKWRSKPDGSYTSHERSHRKQEHDKKKRKHRKASKTDARRKSKKGHPHILSVPSTLLMNVDERESKGSSVRITPSGTYVSLKPEQSISRVTFSLSDLEQSSTISSPSRSQVKMGYPELYTELSQSNMESQATLGFKVSSTGGFPSPPGMGISRQKPKAADFSSSAPAVDIEQKKSEMAREALELMKSDPMLSEYYSCSKNLLTIAEDPSQFVWRDESSDSDSGTTIPTAADEVDEELQYDEKPEKSRTAALLALFASEPKTTIKYKDESEAEVKETLFRAPLWFRRKIMENRYDPHKHRWQLYLSTNIETMLHIIKTCTGTGIMTMPYAFMHAGLFNGVTSTVFLMSFTSYCINMLIKCQYAICKRNRVPMLTYPDTLVAALTVGPTFLRRFSVYAGSFLESVIVMNQTLLSTAYCMFMCSNIKDIVDVHFMEQFNKTLDTNFYLMIMFVFLIAISMIRTIKTHTDIALIGNGLMFFSVAIIIARILRDWDFKTNAELVAYPLKYPIFFGIALFTFNSVSTVVAIENHMQHPKSFGGFLGIWNVSMMLFTALVTIVGYLGYLRYGNDIQPIFTQNLPVNDRILSVARIAFVFSLFLSFGMVAYVPSKIFIRRSKRFPHAVTWEYFIRVALVVAPVIIASVIPRVEIVVSLTGSICGSFLKFIIPALIELCLKCSEEIPLLRWAIIIDVLIIFFGVLGMFAGIYQALKLFIS